MTHPPEEPLREVTPADVVAGKARTLLERYAEVARDPDSAANIRENLRSQLRNLVDPQRPIETRVDLLLAEADRFAGQNPDPEDLVAAICAALGITDEGPRFRTASEALKDPEPVPLLHRKAGGAILSVGEIAVLSGEGGTGKSTLAAQLAMTAACTDDASFAKAAGLMVQGGPVVVASYEDRARRVAERLNQVKLKLEDGHNGKPRKADDPMNRVHIADMAGWPLFGVAPGNSQWDHPERLPAWQTTWQFISDLEPRPRFVIIDPVGEAFAANSNELASVRAFYGALRKAAEKAECGVLLVAHSTKEDRKKPGATPGAVAGSAAWTDAARGVLTLDRGGEPDNPQPNDPFTLRLVKANYAARFALSLGAWTHSNGALVGFHEPENKTMSSAEI